MQQFRPQEASRSDQAHKARTQYPGRPASVSTPPAMPALAKPTAPAASPIRMPGSPVTTTMSTSTPPAFSPVHMPAAPMTSPMSMVNRVQENRTDLIRPVNGGSLVQRNMQIARVEQYSPAPISAPLPDGRTTTQSLVLSVPGTSGKRKGRSPVVIPGTRKQVVHLPDTDALSIPEQQRSPRRLKLPTRHGAAILITFGVLLLVLFSFTPINNDLPFISGTVKLVQANQQQDNFAIAQANQMKQTDGTSSTNTSNDTNLSYDQLVQIAEQDADKYGISEVYFVNQIHQESGFNPSATSYVGAEGIAQFMPSTAAGMGINPWDPIQALDGAARYMAAKSAEFDGNYAMALASYNAGSGNVDNAIAEGGSDWLDYLPYETQNYVNIIMYGTDYAL